ncbi:MAG TPA: STN domain-containing protein, partial [Nitrosospira sp.]|nr:STN domain-containing protein [Nitrosospira sp.]
MSIAFIPPHSTAAEPDASAREAIYTYDIPTGSLEEALNRFATQAGIPVSFDTEEVKGKTAQALKGSFSVQAGLNQLL